MRHLAKSQCRILDEGAMHGRLIRQIRRKASRQIEAEVLAVRPGLRRDLHSGPVCQLSFALPPGRIEKHDVVRIDEVECQEPRAPCAMSETFPASQSRPHSASEASADAPS